MSASLSARSTDAGAEDDDDDDDKRRRRRRGGDIKRRARTLTLATRFPDVINIFT